MYEICRRFNCPLPDDPELKKNENDTILILEPFKNERPDLILPSIPSKQIRISSMMNIEVLKKYIKNKIVLIFDIGCELR